MKAIHAKLTEEDFRFLTEFGILKKDLKYTKTAIKDGKTVIQQISVIKPTEQK
jgi:hypothetical protein